MAQKEIKKAGKQSSKSDDDDFEEFLLSKKREIAKSFAPELEVKAGAAPKMALPRSLMPKGPKSIGRGDRFNRFRVFTQTNITVNSTAGKYAQFFSGSTILHWYDVVAAMSELSSLDVLYDELFVHNVKLEYVPRNKYSANTTAQNSAAAGQPGFANTCAAVIVFLPHNAAPYTDTSTMWSGMRASPTSKLLDLGDRWSFTAKNPEKFEWGGPSSDQSTSTNAMGWMSFGNAGGGQKLGGIFQIATPLPSAASATYAFLQEGGCFGDVSISALISVRARA